jgi:hypothetical protein
MKLLVAVLGLLLGSGAPALAATAAASQTLAMRVHGDGVQATHLPSYDPRVPIAVTVRAGEKRMDALSLLAYSPAGRSLNVPLTRAADGLFAGSLSLPDEGRWRLQLASRNGTLRTLTAPVMLDVAAPPPSNTAPVGWAVGTAIFIAFGGGGFLLLRRAGRQARPFELDRAA